MRSTGLPTPPGFRSKRRRQPRAPISALRSGSTASTSPPAPDRCHTAGALLYPGSTAIGKIPGYSRGTANIFDCLASLIGCGHWRLLLRAEFVIRSYGASKLGSLGSDEARGGELDPYPSVACGATAVCSLPPQAARMSARGKTSRTGRRIDADAVRAQIGIMIELQIISSKLMPLICRFAPTRASVTPSRDRDRLRYLLAGAQPHQCLSRKTP